MYIDGKLVDSTPLNLHQIHDSSERDLYIQGAINFLLENWDEPIDDQKLEPQFFIRGKSQFW
jgi:hypothetical protein